MNLELLSLDQLRVFVVIAEQGSFSAAARHLGRAQSAVSYAVMTLEQQLGCKLFDRSSHRPALTQEGRVLLGDARNILARTDNMVERARSMAGGLEPEMPVVVDVMYPVDDLVAVLRDFGQTFPTVTLKLYVEALGATAARLLDGSCTVGVVATLPQLPEGLLGHALPPIQRVPVAAPGHPLARHGGPIPHEMLRDHVQLVLTDRSSLTAGRDFGVVSGQTWRLSDLGTTRALLRAGLGWGNLPLHMAEDDLAHGRLIRLSVQHRSLPDDQLPLHVVHRGYHTLGPAGRWLVERFRATPSNNSMETN